MRKRTNQQARKAVHRINRGKGQEPIAQERAEAALLAAEMLVHAYERTDADHFDGIENAYHAAQKALEATIVGPRVAEDPAGLFAEDGLEIDQPPSRSEPLPTGWQRDRDSDGVDRELIPPERIDAAFRAARILVHAYQCGFENSGSIPWAQLDDAYEAALAATEEEPRVAEEGAS
ncbi:hypothetical protein K2Z84_18775 [Candidatus Binatia bacterium]|nr:hypothetical protein [Candidatus Binatia bacterium]